MFVKQTNMAEHKREHKHESGSESSHDSYDDHSYKKRCYCERCKGTYNEWCKRHKEAGHTVCKRKCYTVCEIQCHKEVVHHKDWAFRKEYEGKWEPYHGDKHEPKKCACGKAKNECSCGDKRRAPRKN